MPHQFRRSFQSRDPADFCDGPSAVAAALKKYKISAKYVSNVKLKMKGADLRGRKRGRRGRAAAANGQADVNAMRAAASFIKSCGSIEAAREAFSAAEHVASALE